MTQRRSASAHVLASMNTVAIALDTTGLSHGNPNGFRPCVIAIGLAAVEREEWTGGFALVRPIGEGTDLYGNDDGGLRASERHLALAGQALGINRLTARTILDEGISPYEAWGFVRAFTAGRRLVGFNISFLNHFLPIDLRIRDADDVMIHAASALYGGKRRRVALDNAFAAIVDPSANLPEGEGRAHWNAIRALAVDRVCRPNSATRIKADPATRIADVFPGFTDDEIPF